MREEASQMSGTPETRQSGVTQPNIDTSKLDVRGTPVFLLRGLLIRYHPDDAKGPVSVDGVEMTSLAGLIGLQGFDQTNAGVLNCHFVADENVTPGTVVFEPMSP